MKVPFPLLPPADLIARAKFSSHSRRNAHGRKNLLSFLSHADKRDFNYYLCRCMAAEWRFFMRIGHGYDVHQLKTGEKLIIGGVDIPHDKGLLGHSDADVLVHAVMDALLGAAALPDIGVHFPCSDMSLKGISSIELLIRVRDILADAGFEVVNIDSTLSAQKPKMAPHIPAMRKNMADALKIDVSQVNVKATTTEWLGFEGREEGISATAVCLLKKI